jgi:8-oxo-dGTP diphosphatase
MNTFKPPTYKYCPMCGKGLTEIKVNGEAYQACSDRTACKWIRWEHTPITVAVIIRDLNNPERILLVKRNNEPFKGLWSLPAGFAEYGEMPSEAAKRELKEEVGLSASHLKLIGQYLESSHPKTFSILNVFAAEGITGNASPSDDAEDLAYYSWKSLPKMAFAGQVLAIDDFFK